MINNDFCLFRRKNDDLLNLTSNEPITSKQSHNSFSRKKENQPKSTLSNSNIKLCKALIITLVHKHFKDEKPSLKNGGKLKWNLISDEYNEIVKSALEKETPNTLNAKWRNIVYRAKIMKDPYPLNDPSKPIISIKILQDRINQLKSNSENEKNICQKERESLQELSASNKSENNVHPPEEFNIMSLSDVKKQFRIGL